MLSKAARVMGQEGGTARTKALSPAERTRFDQPPRDRSTAAAGVRQAAFGALVWVLIVPGEHWSWTIVDGPWGTAELCAHARLQLDEAVGYPTGLCVDLRRPQPETPTEPPAASVDGDQASYRSW